MNMQLSCMYSAIILNRYNDFTNTNRSDGDKVLDFSPLGTQQNDLTNDIKKDGSGKCKGICH